MVGGYVSWMPYRARDATRPDRAPALHRPWTDAADDLPGTLRAVSAAGYRAVELAGLPETATTELAALLNDVGTARVASHEGIERLRDDIDGRGRAAGGARVSRA